MGNPASELAKMRRQIDHQCANCGAPFTGIKTAKFCSNRCRQAAKNERNRAAKKNPAKAG